MKAAEVKQLNDAELSGKLAELDKELFNLRIQAKTGQLETPSRIKAVRRDIARVKTEQTARKN